MRSIKSAPEIINDSPPYLTVDGKDNLKVKEVLFNDNRYIVCLNGEEAKRDKAVREHIEEKLRARLKNGNVKDLIGNSEYKRYIKVVDQAATINEEKLKQAELFDGQYIIQTNTGLPTEEVATAYRDLWKIKRAFRSLKSTLDLRPVYHWTEKRICGTLCSVSSLWSCRSNSKSF